MKKILILILLIPIATCYGQLEIKVPKERIIKADEAKRMYEFIPGRELSHNEMVNFWSSDLVKTNSDVKPVYETVNTDNSGNEHYIYKQFFNGTEIENECLVVHKNKKESTVSITGKLSTIKGAVLSPAINEEQINSKIRNIFSDSEIDYSMINIMNQNRTKNNSKLIFPNSSLVYLKTGEDYKLVYKTIVSVKEPYNNWQIYVDAVTGEVVKKNSLVKSCFGKRDEVITEKTESKGPFDVTSCSGSCYPGTGNALYYGNVSINTGKYQANMFDCKYRLFNNCAGADIHTRDAGDVAGEISDQDNDWQWMETRPGVTAHWCAYMAFNYFLTNFSRNSFDDQGSKLDVFVNGNAWGVSNAAWTGINIHCGTGGESGVSYDDITTLDILGHEYTHGIDESSANLTYQNESGALSESFADMFGSMVENYAKTNFLSGTGNYTQGEDAYHPNCGALRNMANPKQYCQPNTHGGQYYYWGPNDFGGVHTNSGVGNYWFYLLAEGGSGINDNNSSYCVKGIGRQKAAAIAYSTLINYLPAYNGVPDYYDARVESINAAQALYGNNSEEVASVTAAWYAVGVGMDYTGSIDIKNFNVSSTYTKNYFHKIALSNVNVNSGGNLNVSSATGIKATNFKSYAGSTSKLHIALGCTQNGKLFDTQVLNPIKNKNEEIGAIIEENSLFKVFPSPNNGSFTVKFDGKGEGVLEIRSILGQILYSEKTQGELLKEINLGQEVKSGMYFVVFDDQKGNKYRQKFIKE